MTQINQLPMPTLDAIAAKYSDIKWVREQTAFYAIAMLGMCRHEYLSPDWVAHNELSASVSRRLREMPQVGPYGEADIRESITTEIKKLGLWPVWVTS